MLSSNATHEKIIQALDIAANKSLERLTNESEISLKDYKEMLAFLIKAAELITKYKQNSSKGEAQSLSPTDRLLLERYANRQPH